MPRKGVNILNNKVYGLHERHRIDVYQPAKSTSLTPIVIFLHGGRFVRGHKKGSANIGTYFARHGILGIIAN